jgi:hypothetical protein
MVGQNVSNLEMPDVANKSANSNKAQNSATERIRNRPPKKIDAEAIRALQGSVVA